MPSIGLSRLTTGFLRHRGPVSYNPSLLNTKYFWINETLELTPISIRKLWGPLLIFTREPIRIGITFVETRYCIHFSMSKSCFILHLPFLLLPYSFTYLILLRKDEIQIDQGGIWTQNVNANGNVGMDVCVQAAANCVNKKYKNNELKTSTTREETQKTTLQQLWAVYLLLTSRISRQN